MDNLKKRPQLGSCVNKGSKKKGNRWSSHCLTAAGIMGRGDTSCLYYDDILNHITMCFNQKHLTQQSLWRDNWQQIFDFFSPQEDRLKWILIYNRHERNSKADWGEKPAIFIIEFLQLMMERNFKASVISDTEQNTDRNKQTSTVFLLPALSHIRVSPWQCYKQGLSMDTPRRGHWAVYYMRTLAVQVM